MGGSVERIEVLFIADPRKDPAQAQAELTATFENFDAAKAECFLPKDRERLLAVIEAGFGDVREFNKIVRRIFAGRGRCALRTPTAVSCTGHPSNE